MPGSPTMRTATVPSEPMTCKHYLCPRMLPGAAGPGNFESNDAPAMHPKWNEVKHATESKCDSTSAL